MLWILRIHWKYEKLAWQVLWGSPVWLSELNSLMFRMKSFYVSLCILFSGGFPWALTCPIILEVGHPVLLLWIYLPLCQAAHNMKRNCHFRRVKEGREGLFSTWPAHPIPALCSRFCAQTYLGSQKDLANKPVLGLQVASLSQSWTAGNILPLVQPHHQRSSSSVYLNEAKNLCISKND